MKTQKELLGEHRAGLDAQFKAKYPQGKFTVYRGGYYALYWSPRRNTSHAKYRGIGFETRKVYSTEKGVFPVSHQNNSFGKCNNYDSLDKMVAAARGFGIGEDLIEAFVARYNDRAKEGFTE